MPMICHPRVGCVATRLQFGRVTVRATYRLCIARAPAQGAGEAGASVGELEAEEDLVFLHEGEKELHKEGVPDSRAGSLIPAARGGEARAPHMRKHVFLAHRLLEGFLRWGPGWGIGLGRRGGTALLILSSLNIFIANLCLVFTCCTKATAPCPAAGE
jgi:hypothetical protein